MKWICLVALAVPAAVAAQEPPIRIWARPPCLGVAQRWADAYAKTNPEAHFEFAMKGSDSAIHGLTGDVADIALMGRKNDIVDDFGFSRPKEYPATGIEIANGSLSTPGKSNAVAVLVPAANPINSLTREQLARIIDCGGEGAPISTWGDLGLTGSWATRPIHVYSYDFSMRTARWFQDEVTHGDRRMCWDRMSEYNDARRLDGTLVQAADRVGEGARSDPDALAIANPGQARNGLKLVALASGTGPAVPPTAETIVNRSYSLARRAYAFVDRKPGTALAPHVLAFLRFALSPAGQALLTKDEGYLPLDPVTARKQIAVLEEIQ